MDMDYNEVVKIYLHIVDTLLEKDRLDANRRLCICTGSGRHGNFRPTTFKAIASNYIDAKHYTEYMRIFRTFEWLICKPEKFTNVQKIDGRPIRVITVDLNKYKLMKELFNEG